MYTKGIILNIFGNCLLISTESKYILSSDPAILLLDACVPKKHILILHGGIMYNISKLKYPKCSFRVK